MHACEHFIEVALAIAPTLIGIQTSLAFLSRTSTTVCCMALLT